MPSHTPSRKLSRNPSRARTEFFGPVAPLLEVPVGMRSYCVFRMMESLPMLSTYGAL